MSEQSEVNKENGIVGKGRTEITVEVIEEKDIPEVLQLLKEFFFKVSTLWETLVGKGHARV